AGAVLLSSPAGVESTRIIPAEGGRLIFITPTATLLADTLYTLSLSGAIDIAGRLLPPTAIHFTTEHGTATTRTPPPAGGSTPAAPSSPPDGRVTAPADDWNWTGALRDGHPYSSWQALPPLTAPSGVTAVAGQVLTLNGEPLAEVTVETEGPDDSRSTTRTDRSGRFLLIGPQA